MRPAKELRPGTAADWDGFTWTMWLILNLSQENDKQLIALNDALDELAQGDPRKARVVELRYFGGLNVQDTAAVLKVSEETVTRDWRLARGWLLLQVRGLDGSGAPGLAEDLSGEGDGCRGLNVYASFQGSR